MDLGFVVYGLRCSTGLTCSYYVDMFVLLTTDYLASIMIPSV